MQGARRYRGFAAIEHRPLAALFLGASEYNGSRSTKIPSAAPRTLDGERVVAGERGEPDFPALPVLGWPIALTCLGAPRDPEQGFRLIPSTRSD